MSACPRWLVAAALSTVAVAPLASAHHSQAMFELDKCRTISGTVRTFEYQYPHSWLWVFVPDGKGGQDVWGLEGAAPANLLEKDKRWKRDVLKKGDKVTVRFSPMRDGRKGGSMASVTLDATNTTLVVPAPTCGGKPPVPASALRPGDPDGKH